MRRVLQRLSDFLRARIKRWNFGVVSVLVLVSLLGSGIVSSHLELSMIVYGAKAPVSFPGT